MPTPEALSEDDTMTDSEDASSSCGGSTLISSDIAKGSTSSDDDARHSDLDSPSPASASKDPEAESAPGMPERDIIDSSRKILITITQDASNPVEFLIHESLLLEYTSYFHYQLRTPTASRAQRLSQTITLTSVTVPTFQLFANWLYGQQIPTTTANPSSTIFSLILAYLFGMHICCPDFRDAVIDALVAVLLEHPEITMETSVRMVYQVWPEVRNESPAGRFIVLLMAASWNGEAEVEAPWVDKLFFEAVLAAEKVYGQHGSCDQILRKALADDPCLFHEHGSRTGVCHRGVRSGGMTD